MLSWFGMARKITALKAQKRDPDRINVYLDGEYTFGLARILIAWLRVGQELEETKITELQQQDKHEKAYAAALRLLSYRSRSENEIRYKLNRKGYESEEINLVLDRLRTAGLVSDGDFGRIWVENRSTFRPRSQRLLAFELRKKGLADEVIQEALKDSEPDEVLAYQAALRQVRKLSGLEWLKFRERLSSFLLRRGFNYETVKTAVQQVWDETHPEGQNHSQMEEEVD
jgi:regulatory protein